MQIDWQQTIEEILSDKISCPRCGALVPEVMAGYLRSPAGSQYSPICQGCNPREECDSRKLVVLCEPCGREFRLRGRKVDREGMMVALLEECRRSLEESLEFLADYWREELDIDPEDMDKNLEEVDPQLFAQENGWRRHLEEQYLGYHRWFHQHGLRIPNPGWRSEYAEEIIALGYETLLGD
jgi:hypothetical protein